MGIIACLYNKLQELLLWLTHDGIDLYDQTQYDNDGCQRDTTEAIYLFRLKFIRIVGITAGHQQEADHNDHQTRYHDLIIIFRENGSGLRHCFFFFNIHILLNCQNQYKSSSFNRRYFITERCVLTRDIKIPMMIIPIKRVAIIK